MPQRSMYSLQSHYFNKTLFVSGRMREISHYHSDLVVTGGAVNKNNSILIMRSYNAHVARYAVPGIGAGKNNHISCKARINRNDFSRVLVIHRGARHFYSKMIKYVVNKARAIKPFLRSALRVAVFCSNKFFREVQ